MPKPKPTTLTGIPYRWNGQPVTRAEYVRLSRQQKQRNIVAELRDYVDANKTPAPHPAPADTTANPAASPGEHDDNATGETGEHDET